MKVQAESRKQSKKIPILGIKRKVLPNVKRQTSQKASKGALGEKKVLLNSTDSEVVSKDSKESVSASGGESVSTSGGALDFLQMYGDDDSDSD